MKNIERKHSAMQIQSGVDPATGLLRPVMRASQARRDAPICIA